MRDTKIKKKEMTNLTLSNTPWHEDAQGLHVDLQLRTFLNSELDESR
jgi:hypothetical protein